MMRFDSAAEWTSELDSNAPSDARTRLGEYAARFHPNVPIDAWDTAHLLVTELVTNAVQHGRGRVHVRIFDDGQSLRIEVSDTGLGSPRIQVVDALATQGRGLFLVEALATIWGVRWFAAPEVNPAAPWGSDSPTGKSVWLELPSMS